MASVTISTGAGTTVTEGNHAIARYTLSSALTTATVVNVSLTGWGASATGDYSGDLEVSMGTSGVWGGVSGGQITLSAGVTEFSLRTYVNPDSLTEVSEAVVFVVSQNASTVGIADSWWVQNIVSIADPAAAAPGAPIVPVSISAVVTTPSPATATEGTAAMSTFHLSGALGVATSISASVTGWGATAGADYSVLYYRPGSAAYSTSGWIAVGPDGLIALAAGTTDFQLGVDVYADTVTESYESVVFVVNQNAATLGITNSWYVSSQVNLADPASAAPGAPIVPVSISAVVTTPSPATATEGTAAMSTFHLSGALGVATSISASVTGWGATAGADYSVLYYRPGSAAYSTSGWIAVGPDGLIALAAGTTDFQLGVDVYADTLTESYESVVFVVNQNAATLGITNSWYVSSQVNLADPASAAPGAPIVPVSISAVVTTPSPATATEGTAAMSTFHLSGALGVATSISASVTGWGATAGVDYSVLYYRPGSAAYSTSGWVAVGPDGLIALAAGTTDFQLGVDVYADTLTESYESVVFVVNQNAATLGITNSWYVSSQVNLADPASAAPGAPIVPVSISAVVTTPSPATATEGTAAMSTFHLSGALGVATSISASVTGWGATAGVDYSVLYYRPGSAAYSTSGWVAVGPDGLIALAAGTTDFQLGVDVYADTLTESYESVVFVVNQNASTVGITNSWYVSSQVNLADAVPVINTATPSITSGATANFAENGTGTVYTATATDADLGTTLTYAISGGADSAKFSIDASTGAVTFASAPNYEIPTDAGADNIYNITVTASDGTNTSIAKDVAITVTDVYESLAGQSVIDLGSYGKLIAPVQVEGKWYYYWDRSGDGSSSNTGSLNGGLDYTSHDILDGIFTQDVSGNTGGGGNTSDTYRYATLNGVHLALPTANGGVTYPQGYDFQNGTAYTDAGVTTNGTTSSFNELLAIWDAYNGTGTGTNINGTPSDWQAVNYWSATSSASGHAVVTLVNGYVFDNGDIGNLYVALQVL